MTVTTTRSIITGTIFLVLFSFRALAQPQAVTRVEGVVIDADTKKPVGCKIYVYNPEGKQVRSTKSSDADGTYLVVINEAGKHKFVMGGHNVYKAEFEVEIPKNANFQDVKRDFMVNAFVEGKELASLRAFELNSAVLTSKGSKTLSEIKEALEVNQQLRVAIDVLPDADQLAALQEDSLRAYIQDSLDYDSELKKWEKKYKKKKEKPEPPQPPVRRAMPADPNGELVQARIAAVNSVLKDVRNHDVRVEISAKPLPANLRKEAASEESILEEMTAKNKKKTKKKNDTKSSKSEKPAQPDHSTLIIRIGKVQRLFE